MMASVATKLLPYGMPNINDAPDSAAVEIASDYGKMVRRSGVPTPLFRL
jgi:hypothetical protein